MSRAKRNYAPYIWGLSLVIYLVIALLAYLPGVGGLEGADLSYLPMLNAILNSFTFAFLLAAYISILRKQVERHRRLIYAAFITTTLFLLTYVTYHTLTPSTPFGGVGWIRPVYFFLLITHILLAIAIVPMALFSAVYGLSMEVPSHRRVARWTMPLWLYVSATGVIVYLMIRPYY